ncbi:MAG: ATP-grasp domain-containing protein [Chloroflexota bacterium]
MSGRLGRVLVTDAARGSAVAVIRSLSRVGWHVIAADSSPLAPGLYSRYARERVRYPSPRRAPDAAIDALRSIVRERSVDVLVALTDDIILPLAAARDSFASCMIALPTTEALEAAADKSATVRLAEEVGVPVPRTVVAHTVDDALGLVSEFRWPIVLKPARSKSYRRDKPIRTFAVTYAEDLEQLRTKLARIGEVPVLMQEYYPGEGHGVGILLHEGRALAAFQHRRLREFPLTGGTSSFRESVALDPALYGHAVRLLERLGWTGPALVEFKIGADGPRLMEINGRVWGSLPLAVKSGVDFPALWLDLYRSGPPPIGVPPKTEYRIGVRSRDLPTELAWIGAVLRWKRRYVFETKPSRAHALRVALGLLSPASGYDVLSLADPAPGIVELIGTARLAAAELRGRAHGHVNELPGGGLAEMETASGRMPL